jgi:hypothetical protein
LITIESSKKIPKLTSKIARNEYRTQNNKRHLTQKGYKGVLGKGFLEKRYMFLFFQKEHTFGEYRTQKTFGGPKNAKRNTLFAKQETALGPRVWSQRVNEISKKNKGPESAIYKQYSLNLALCQI